ncbi:invasion associated locus B family protein [Pelagibacterium sediminicola]|uniref:invasion associated locus B family protein n=1 Tax=Pelagibacterium sediminicola TaxID=2248761 RepID=UPI001300A454|nr:invasion associated locus B family protein [Pelagibacterium sediminicola]
MTSGQSGRMRRAAIGVLAGLVIMVSATGASAATNLGTFTHWTAWTDTDGGSKICYVAANPQTREPSNLNHGDIAKTFLLVTIRPANRNEVAVLVDFPVSSSSPNASATVDGRSYPMVTEGQAGWLASVEDEAGFVAAMRAGATLQVRITSGAGNNTVHTYSLSGVTAALNRAAQECPQ